MEKAVALESLLREVAAQKRAAIFVAGRGWG
jgi:hypothetical protein